MNKCDYAVIIFDYMILFWFLTQVRFNIVPNDQEQWKHITYVWFDNDEMKTNSRDRPPLSILKAMGKIF